MAAGREEREEEKFTIIDSVKAPCVFSDRTSKAVTLTCLTSISMDPNTSRHV